MHTNTQLSSNTYQSICQFWPRSTSRPCPHPTDVVPQLASTIADGSSQKGVLKGQLHSGTLAPRRLAELQRLVEGEDGLASILCLGMNLPSLEAARVHIAECNEVQGARLATRTDVNSTQAKRSLEMVCQFPIGRFGTQVATEQQPAPQPGMSSEAVNDQAGSIPACDNNGKTRRAAGSHDHDRAEKFRKVWGADRQQCPFHVHAAWAVGARKSRKPAAVLGLATPHIAAASFQPKVGAPSNVSFEAHNHMQLDDPAHGAVHEVIAEITAWTEADKPHAPAAVRRTVPGDAGGVRFLVCNPKHLCMPRVEDKGGGKPRVKRTAYLTAQIAEAVRQNLRGDVALTLDAVAATISPLLFDKEFARVLASEVKAVLSKELEMAAGYPALYLQVYREVAEELGHQVQRDPKPGTSAGPNTGPSPFPK